MRGSLPNWVYRPLGELTDKIGSGATPRGGQGAYKKSGVSLIRSLNVHDLQFRYKDLARVDDEQAEALSNVEVEARDVLLNITGASIARCTQVPLDVLPARVNQHVSILRPKNGLLDSRFLSYLLVSDGTKNQLLNIGDKAGATRQALTKAQLQAFAIPVPPLGEQERIVAVLDQAFAALDRSRAHAEANLADAKSLFDGALRKAFALHLDWPVKFLPEISENLDRQRVPITKHDRQPGDIPYYGASGVVDQVAGHIFDEALLLVSEDGANLLARTYPIAFSISGKSWVNNHAHVLRFSDVDTQEYVRLYLNSITLAPYVSGMAQPKLNQKALNQIPIPFPDEDRRAAIVAEAALIREHCNALSRSYDAQLTDLATLRQSLLHKAFSGELT